MSDLKERLLELRAKATPGTWSWEDGPPTVYAGRVDPVGEIAGMSVCGHGFNLFGRLTDLSRNGRNDLEYAVACVNATPALLARIEQLEAEVRRLREALKPFADAAEDLDDAHRDDSDIWQAAVGMSIFAGDLRAARATLSEGE